MKLGYELTIEQTQKLSMTPELIQAIQILQFTSQDLLEYVKDELLENPILEPEKNQTIEEIAPIEVDIREKILNENYYESSFKNWENDPDGEEDYSFDQYMSEETTLKDFLNNQLTFVSVEGKDINVAKYIIESLDDNGYLTLSLEEISREFNVSERKSQEILEIIQSFEPIGVGARDLRECLILQLLYKGLLTDELEFMINNMLEEIASNKIGVMAKTLGLKTSEIQEMIDVIKSLEPKPGRMFYSGENTKYVIPDVFVEKINGEYVITNNEGSVPSLKVSSYYNKLAKDAKSDEVLNKYLTDKFNSALWLIKSIEQRKHTIYNVAEAIVEYQRDFFDKGEKFLKTLTLRQIAEKVNVHESTVSRSINGKYMQTPRGLFEMKYFFSSGVSKGDEELSSNSIKSFIREYIRDENPQKPLSDQIIAEMLLKRGIEISRRTVAKYREGMDIPSSSKRRRY